MINTVWKQPLVEIRGWDRLGSKLFACVQSLIQWKNKLQEPKPGHSSQLREHLAKLQGHDDMGNNEEISRLKRDIQIQLDKYDLWWRQGLKQIGSSMEI